MHITNEIAQYIDSFKSEFPNYKLISPSWTEQDNVFLALAQNGPEKKLVVATDNGNELPPGFTGRSRESGAVRLLLCDLNHENAGALRSFLPYTSPSTIGNVDSFGFGDRLGNAGPAHLRSLGPDPVFVPVMAQQSIRELDRTKRTAEEVLDAATWAVFQEGYRDGFGADADHLKTPEDIDRMISAGFTMFTIDPSDHVDNRSEEMNAGELRESFKKLPWDKLRDKPDMFLRRYVDVEFNFDDDMSLHPSETDILRAAIKYGNVVVHTRDMFRYLRENYPDHESEVELSVDETPHPTTPEEHLVVASELQRLGVELVSLAPRFCGDFEKGIDFKGDIGEFRKEYLLHQAIAASYGEYKLSIHSGSDKFSVYEAIGELGKGRVHVKTAGTSYLEALRAVALSEPSFFRELIAFSRERFDTDRKSYHISADAGKLEDPLAMPDQRLPELLDDDNARQVFHVTFGSVLTQTDEDGRPLFRDRIMQVLTENQKVYDDCLYNHFRRHIRPFEKDSNS